MTQWSDSAREYARANAERFREELKDLIRIPSVSADPAYKGDVQRAAEWLASHLRGLGASNVQVMPTGGHPVVYGEWLGAGADKPTVLVYGHYDVQPAAMEDGWSTQPFEPVEKDGFIYARGSSDDKGQMYIHVKAFESFMKGSGTSPVNLKFFLEGEEEIGSKNLTNFIKANLELLRADVCVISDTGMRRIEEPAITHSVRGLTYMQVEVQGPATDQHSGLWGGAVHNPALALVHILSKLHNPDHSIAVPGFYEGVPTLTEAERAELEKTGISEEYLKQDSGAPGAWGEAAYTIKERVAARPTMEINGLLSGWTGEGPKTVLPAKAMAKISCRLVGTQSSERIYELVKNYIESITPPTVTVQVKLLSLGEPALIDYNIPEMQAASRAYEKAWGAKPIFVREGGSIPVVADVMKLMKVPVIMLGFGLTSDGAHGPDEHYSIEMFHKGIETAIVFYEELANMPR